MVKEILDERLMDVKKFYTIDNDKSLTIEFMDPHLCWKCLRHIVPSVIYGHSVTNAPTTSTIVSLMLQCPACSAISLGVYSVNEGSLYVQSRIAHPLLLTPNLIPVSNFPEKVSSVSPSFIEIYEQAMSAESSKLFHIAGMGYRKALEFLIKDYLCYKHPDDSTTIENMPLAQCIRTYIDERHLNASLLAAVWVGNDETHYRKKHADKDISNIKSFISSAVFFIVSELTAMEAAEFIGR
jgi:hypothetical protein